MAEIKILKIGSDGFDTEHDSAADQITMSGFTADNTNGFAVTSGVTITQDIVFNAVDDEIAGIENQNLLDKTADEDYTGKFNVLGGNLILPNGAQSSPDTNEVYFDGSSLLVWDGSQWVDIGASGASDSVKVTYTAAGGGISQYDAVYISAADTVDKADASAKATAKVIGFAPSAIGGSGSGLIQVSGVLAGAISESGVSAGDAMFLDTTAGQISTSRPTGAGEVVILVGYAKNATDLHIQIQGIRVRAS